MPECKCDFIQKDHSKKELINEYSRCLQAADDVEGSVGKLVQLEEGRKAMCEERSFTVGYLLKKIGVHIYIHIYTLIFT